MLRLMYIGVRIFPRMNIFDVKIDVLQDRASATEAVDQLGSIFGRTNQRLLKMGIHSFPAWRSAIRDSAKPPPCVVDDGRYPYTTLKSTFQKIICLQNISLNVLFPELAFVRNHTWLKLHQPESTFVWIYISPKACLPEFALARNLH